MKVEDFAVRMMELMPKMVRGLARYDHRYLAEGIITIPQLWTLQRLRGAGKSKMSDIAVFLNISKPAVTGLVDRLIIQGLVVRLRGEKDRRNVWVELSAKGKKIANGIREKKRKTLVKVFSKMSASDRAEQIRIIEEAMKILYPEENPEKGKKAEK
jgi:DNA-binding MarR family transcriptional regulator